MRKGSHGNLLCKQKISLLKHSKSFQQAELDTEKKKTKLPLPHLTFSFLFFCRKCVPNGTNYAKNDCVSNTALIVCDNFSIGYWHNAKEREPELHISSSDNFELSCNAKCF